jgi:hypothetical protein
MRGLPLRKPNRLIGTRFEVLCRWSWTIQVLPFDTCRLENEDEVSNNNLGYSDVPYGQSKASRLHFLVWRYLQCPRVSTFKRFWGWNFCERRMGLKILGNVLVRSTKLQTSNLKSEEWYQEYMHRHIKTIRNDNMYVLSPKEVLKVVGQSKGNRNIAYKRVPH